MALGVVPAALERTRERVRAANQANPTNSIMQADGAWIETVLGDRLASAGRDAEAMAAYERAIAVRQRLSKANPTTVRQIEQQIHLQIGSLHENAGRATQPSIHKYRRRLADSTRRLGTVLHAAGRPADAIARYRESLAELNQLDPPTPIDLYDMACCHSLIAGSAPLAGSGLSEAVGLSETELAVAGVRRAIDAGYRNLRRIREGDPDLQPNRSRRDFQLLMLDLAFPAQPYGHAR